MKDIIMALLRLYHAWRLRRAAEKYAQWKAMREAFDQQMRECFPFGLEMRNRKRFVKYSGYEAKYAERVENLLREKV